MAANYHMWLLIFQLIKISYNVKFSSSCPLATFQGLGSHLCLLAAMLVSTPMELSIIKKVLLDSTRLRLAPYL